MPEIGEVRYVKKLGEVPAEKIATYPDHLGYPSDIYYDSNAKRVRMFVTAYQWQIWDGESWLSRTGDNYAFMDSANN